MPSWVPLCPLAAAPQEGEVAQLDAAGTAVCLARVNGELSALDNWCPHRQGPLGEGWIEGNAVVCPWHSWAFNLYTGLAEPPERARVAVLPLRVEGDQLLVNLDGLTAAPPPSGSPGQSTTTPEPTQE